MPVNSVVASNMSDDIDKDFVVGDRATNENAATYFMFSLGGCVLAVSADIFCEVVVDMACAQVPNSPAVFYGIGHLRGGVIPIYQFYTSCGIDLPRKKIMFCMGQGEKCLGLLIDHLPKAQTFFPSKNLEEKPSQWIDKEFKGYYSLQDGKPIYILSSLDWLEGVFSLVSRLAHKPSLLAG